MELCLGPDWEIQVYREAFFFLLLGKSVVIQQFWIPNSRIISQIVFMGRARNGGISRPVY